MQEPFAILADNLTALPLNLGISDRSKASMAYLLVPITDELIDRVHPAIGEGENWCWFDSYPVPEVVASNNIAYNSFFGSMLPPETDSLDGIAINLQLGWLDFERVLFLCRQWLKPGGQLFFSSFGPDTLFELREAWASLDQFAHVHDFTDLHMLGDQLSKNGFEKPILDTDWQGVEFEDIELLLSDLRMQGCTNRHQQRNRMLTGKNRLAAMKRLFDQHQPVQITFEIIYGYARVPMKEKGSGIQVRPPSR